MTPPRPTLFLEGFSSFSGDDFFKACLVFWFWTQEQKAHPCLSIPDGLPLELDWLESGWHVNDERASHGPFLRVLDIG